MSLNKKSEDKHCQSSSTISSKSQTFNLFSSPYLTCWLPSSSSLSHGHMIAARAPNITLYSSIQIREERANRKVFPF